ncbi:capsid protein [Escherichia coli]|nr:capsid protein [Escherichia coli]
MSQPNHYPCTGGENRRHVVCKNVLRLAGEPPIVRVLNDFQPLLILRVN